MDTLSSLLIKENMISVDDYNSAIKIKDKTKEEMLHVLVENNYVKRKYMYKLIKNVFDIDTVELENKNIDYNVVKLLPEYTARKYNAIPFELKGDSVCVAMVDPLNEIVIEDIKFITKKDVIPYIERKNKIIYAIESYYNNGIAKKSLEVFNNKNIKDTPKVKQLISENIKSSPIVRITNSIIYRAIDKRTSDIHLEPFKDTVKVRYRIDGVLKLVKNIPTDIYPAVCTRLKTISGMDISKKFIPQDGKMNLEIDNKEIDFRVSSIPTIHGEKLVLRILYKQDSDISLQSLELSKQELELVKDILKNPNGIILMVGPTGSGKTTTLYSMLNHLNCEEKNIITIEDPVEYTIDGINQINVNYKSGLGFEKGLRSILRQDPDIIMVGEIRDEPTAQIAIRAAITGHLVFSTLHTRSAFTAIERLTNMNVPKYLISDALIAVIYQRLVRKICPYCKEEYTPSSEELNFLGVDKSLKLFRGRGCVHCNNTGYKGRKAVFEIMYMNDGHRKLICKNDSVEDLKKYSIKNGSISLRHKCRKLVLDGITTVSEMMNVTYENL